MEQNTQNKIHKVAIDKRERMEILGVTEVVSFDDISVILKTVCGEMNIEGRALKIEVLDTERGVVSLEGKVDALYYSEEKESRKGGLFGRFSK